MKQVTFWRYECSICGVFLGEVEQGHEGNLFEASFFPHPSKLELRRRVGEHQARFPQCRDAYAQGKQTMRRRMDG